MICRKVKEYGGDYIRKTIKGLQ
uniref:Uncharacterized protein n=1 Tax=Lepeophtheirus salmonis TaxID=72036 RepID=A0A0K2UM82_LEPSM